MARTRRTAAWAVGLGAVLAASATAAGLQAAAVTSPGDQQTAKLRLAYTCRFPAGRQQIGVQVMAGFPVAATAGKPIQPTGARLAVSMPPPAVAQLARLHAAAVSMVARLTFDVTQRGRSASAAWAGLAAPATPRPATGSLVLTAAGPVPPVTPRSPGDVTLSAAALSMVLTAHGESGTSQGPSTPAALRLACTPAAGQRAALLTVPVAAAHRKSHRPASAQHRRRCPPQPKGGLKLNRHFPLPKRPRGSKVLHPKPVPGCAFVIGYSDVRKLNGAALIGPGLVDLALNVRVVERLRKPVHFEIDTAGQLDFKTCATCKIVHGLPPARATFLGFGFVPVTARLQLRELGNLNIISVGTGFALSRSTVWSEMSLRIHDVTVNGVPLNVGPHCRAARPFLIKLVGTIHSRPPYSLQNGGPLTGRIKIPKFTGCGVRENLNPLFTASISGKRNFAELTQGRLCPLVGTGACPPRVPKPLH